MGGKVDLDDYKDRTTQMNKENQLLVTVEPVEFEKQPVKVQDFRKIYQPF